MIPGGGDVAKPSPLTKVRPFIEAFRELRQDGFFQSLEVTGSWYGNGVGHLMVKATGYVPDKIADMQESLEAFLDPEELLHKLEENAQRFRLGTANITAEVTVSPWVRYNKEETKVIGTIGRQFNLALRIFQNTVRS